MVRSSGRPRWQDDVRHNRGGLSRLVAAAGAQTAPHRETASAHNRGDRSEEERMAPRFSIEDVECILGGLGNQPRAVASRTDALAAGGGDEALFLRPGGIFGLS